MTSEAAVASYADLLEGTYDCVDRIVLNAYDPLCYSAGGFRTWWRRWHDGLDEDLDNAHLMRLAGRFSRRLRAFAKAEGIPVIDCGKGERKHELAEAYLGEHPDARGLFLILVARAIVLGERSATSRRSAPTSTTTPSTSSTASGAISPSSCRGIPRSGPR